MGFSAQQGAFIARAQSAQGTLATDLATAGVAMKLTSGGLSPNRELMIPDAEIGGNRDVTDALLGPVSYSGDIEAYVRFREIGTLLRAALGPPVSATATGVNTHTFTPSDAQFLPFYTLYQQFGAGLETAQYTDAVCNSLHLESDPDSYLTTTANWIAKTQLLGVPSIDPSTITDDSTMTVGTNITVQLNGVNIKPKSFSLDIANNFEDDDNRLGQFTLEDLTPKRREVTGSLSLRHENYNLMRSAVNGSATAVTPGGLVVKQPILITISTYTDIPAATPATKYSLTFALPSTVFEPFAFEPSGDDYMENDVNFQALRPVASTPVLTAVLKNDVAAIA